MTPSRFLRINTAAADQNCYWTLSGKVPLIQPDNHVLTYNFLEHILFFFEKLREIKFRVFFDFF